MSENAAVDLGRLLFEQAHCMNQQFAAGMRAGKEISKFAHAALKESYTRAQQDSEARIPTILSCAIENVLRLHEEEIVNAYAEAGVQRDNQREPGQEHDRAAHGATLHPGS